MLAWLWNSLAPAGDAVPASLGSPLVRGVIAAAISLAAVLLAGRPTIAWLAGRCRDPNISPASRLRELHRTKSATPTMGGLLVVGVLLAVTCLTGDLANRYVLTALVLVAALAMVGIWDDVQKVTLRRGISPGVKLLAQTAIALPVAVMVYLAQSADGAAGELYVPLIGSLGTLGWWAVPLAVFILVGSTNAVNLADGLDGLAAGCLLLALVVMGAALAIVGDASLAMRFGLPSIVGAGELLVPCGAALGATAGFLWFNRHPARIFLGDTGSLPLGGLLGLLATVARQEALLAIAAGVFVVEALSVIVQLSSLRFLGLRIFRCAPLHHHFQFVGWSEPKVVARFWLAAVASSAVALGLLLFPTQPTREAGPAWSGSPKTVRSAAVEPKKLDRQTK